MEQTIATVVSNPFTPQSGWEPRIFGGRDEQLAHFRGLLRQAVEDHPSHLVLLGEWGIGKTSLLKQFRKIAQGAGYRALYCPVNRFEDAATARDGIDFICQELEAGFPQGPGEAPGLAAGSTGGGGRRTTGAQLQLRLARALREQWRSLQTPLAVVLLDDLQNFGAIPQVLDVLRSVLSRDEVLAETRYLFVMTATPSAWATFLDRHDPIGRFFRKRELIGALRPEETRFVVSETLAPTGVVFEPPVVDAIVELTQGHPYEVQLLAGHLYDSQLQGRVTQVEWPVAFRATLRELGRDYFGALARRASDRERDVLLVLAERQRPMTIADLRSTMIVERRIRNFPIANIKNFLYRLEQKGLVRRSEDGAFRILDPMFAAYLQSGL